MKQIVFFLLKVVAYIPCEYCAWRHRIQRRENPSHYAKDFYVQQLSTQKVASCEAFELIREKQNNSFSSRLDIPRLSYLSHIRERLCENMSENVTIWIFNENDRGWCGYCPHSGKVYTTDSEDFPNMHTAEEQKHFVYGIRFTF